MKINKALLAAGIVSTVATGSLLSIGAASAHMGSGDQSSIVEKIAAKFNLNQDEVQAVFDDEHAARETERDTKRSEHLQELVDAGTITAEQKTALEAKFDEMQTAREALKDQDLTREEMRDKMDEARDSFEAWAEEQGIDLDAIRPEGGPGMGMGRDGHMMGGGPRDEADDSSVDTESTADTN